MKRKYFDNTDLKIHIFKGKYELWIPQTGHRFKNTGGKVQRFNSFEDARKYLDELKSE